MNVLAWVVDALKTHPEPAAFPETLEDDHTEIELAEASSRLQAIAQVATDLRRQVDAQLAAKLDGKALRYGDAVFRPAYRGAPKVSDPERWWMFVAGELTGQDTARNAALLSALYPANAVRLTGLKLLAADADYDPETIKETFIHYDSPTSPLSVMPLSRAPKFLQDLEEGEVR